jgi:hypothetical protein
VLLTAFAGHRLVRRLVHHPEHVLHAGRPANPGARAAAGAGRRSRAGDPVGAGRGAGPGPHRVDPGDCSAGSASPPPCERCSPASGSRWTGSLVLSSSTVAWCYSLGVLVTLLAAYLPARRAAATPPVAAMREDHVAAERSLRRGRWRAPAWPSAVRLAGRQRSVRRHRRDAARRARRARARAGRHRPQPGTGPTVRPVRGRRPAPAVVDRATWPGENAQRNPRRTAATASALMVGLALGVGLQHPRVLRQTRRRRAGRHRGAADYVVSTAVGQPFTPEVAERLRGRGRRAGRQPGAFGLALIGAPRPSSPRSTPPPGPDPASIHGPAAARA